jgi:putative ABC transport system ATP-binding protein
VSDDIVLFLDNAGRTYAGTPPVESLRGVNLSVRAGEMVAVVGPSGSGKTTLLNLAAGLDRPTSGSVRLAGHAVEELSDASLSGLRAYALGVVFQQFFLMEQLSSVDNVANGLLYRGVPTKQRRQAAAEVLDRVGLGHRADHPAGKLSGGERQRVAIARALIGRPALVLADEPTGNLDSANGAQILTLLRDLHADGVTLLLITHDATVAGACPRRVDLHDGRIVADTSLDAGRTE